MSELSTCVGRLGVREEGSITRQMEVNSLHPIILYYANTKRKNSTGQTGTRYRKNPGS